MRNKALKAREKFLKLRDSRDSASDLSEEDENMRLDEMKMDYKNYGRHSSRN